MAAAAIPQPTLTKPKSMTRAKRWSDEVEEVYRFQLAGYRDRHDYAARNGQTGVSVFSGNLNLTLMQSQVKIIMLIIIIIKGNLI